MIEVSWAALATGMEETEDDKTNIWGIYDSIIADKFPYTHPELMIAVQLSYEEEDLGVERRMILEHNDSCSEVTGAVGIMPVKVKIPENGSGILYGSGNIPEIEFEAPGIHTIWVSVLTAEGDDHKPYPVRFYVDDLN